ncbi:hypothetical protein RND81_07G087600 [Saponaria officinalis]|uniref:Exocyst subunit Exo70 family protein n=1 Tax=Saponaria officinalis TaxID=3572 RepID=A0AAW1JP14_SAPOF
MLKNTVIPFMFMIPLLPLPELILTSIYRLCFHILQFLTVQAADSSGGKSTPDATSSLSRAMVKDRYKNFNLQFEELHQRQSQWTIPDSEHRESLRLAVAEVLLPAYRSFIIRYGPMFEGGKNPQKYIRYTAEDLDRMLSEFFEGKNWGEQKR